jgi:hypothetical protein
MKELPLSQMPNSYVSAANDSSLEPLGDNPVPAANAQVRQLAGRLCDLLKADMDRFEQQEDVSLEARTKAMMAFAKTIQFLEELVKRMEIDGSSQYPQDSLEFDRKLERQIEVLANSRGTAGVYMQPDTT